MVWWRKKERARAFGLVEALLFTTSTIALGEWKVVPPVSIYIPKIIIVEQGAIGTLTEWQNLYPRREIMVLGMGLRNGILAYPNPISRPKAVSQ
jgi:hypothetical protein